MCETFKQYHYVESTLYRMCICSACVCKYEFLCMCTFLVALLPLSLTSVPSSSSSSRRPYGSHSVRHFAQRGVHGAGGGPSLRRWAQPVNAGEVPNELVEQAAAVLQGKSRDVIIRELQRTVSADSISSHKPLMRTYVHTQYLPMPM